MPMNDHPDWCHEKRNDEEYEDNATRVASDARQFEPGRWTFSDHVMKNNGMGAWSRIQKGYGTLQRRT